MQAEARFKPWFPATALLNYETHSLTVNGQRYAVQSVQASFEKQTGFITFSTTVTGDALTALSRADRIGYSLSYDKQPGEYSRALTVGDEGTALSNFVSYCASD